MSATNEVETRTDRITKAGEVAYAPFSIPGFSGGTHAAFLNTDTAQAPFVALLKMEPGSLLARHYHPAGIEGIYVVEGEMINDGEVLPAGSFTAHGPGVAHGPHTTAKGCTLMFIQYPGVGPDDSVFV